MVRFYSPSLIVFTALRKKSKVVQPVLPVYVLCLLVTLVKIFSVEKAKERD